MLIRILGTRGEVEPSLPYHSKHSGVLVDHTVMLDLGEEEFLAWEPKNVFVTHLHPDHAFFVRKPARIDIPIYAPSRDVDRTARPMTTGMKVNSYQITPIPTHHSKLVDSQAYLVEDDGDRLLYTGDLVWINKEYHELFGRLPLVVTDGSYLRKGGMIRKDKDTGHLYGHAGIPDLIHMFKEYTRNIMFVHFGAWFYEGARAARNRLEELGRENGVNVLVGYDGMELRIEDLP